MPLDKNNDGLITDPKTPFIEEEEIITLDSLKEAIKRFDYTDSRDKKLSIDFNMTNLDFMADLINQNAQESFANWSENDQINGQDLLEMIYSELVFKDLGYKNAVTAVELLNSSSLATKEFVKPEFDKDYQIRRQFSNIRGTRSKKFDDLSVKVTVGVAGAVYATAVVSATLSGGIPGVIAGAVFGLLPAAIAGVITRVGTSVITGALNIGVNLFSKNSDMKKAEAKADEQIRLFEDTALNDHKRSQEGWYNAFNIFASNNLVEQRENTLEPAVRFKRLPSPRF